MKSLSPFWPKSLSGSWADLQQESEGHPSAWQSAIRRVLFNIMHLPLVIAVWSIIHAQRPLLLQVLAEPRNNGSNPFFRREGQEYVSPNEVKGKRELAAIKWHTPGVWDSVQTPGIHRGRVEDTRGRVEDTSDATTVKIAYGTWAMATMLKKLWENHHIECILFLLVLASFISFASSRHSSKLKGSITFGDRTTGSMTSAQLFFRGSIICLPCLVVGYNLAVIGADVTSIKKEFGVSSQMMGWVASSSCIGCIVGALVNASLVDLLGRKSMHLYLTVVCFFGQLLIFAASSFSLFLCGRLLMGFASGGLSALAPVYLAEIAPMKHRGLLVSLSEQFGSGGLIFGFASAAVSSWGFREHGLLGIFFPVVTLALAPRLLESPRWLIQKGRLEEAKAILQAHIPDEEEVKRTLKAASEAVGSEAAADKKKEEAGFLLSVYELGALLFRHRQQLLMPSILMILEEVVGIEVSDDYAVQFLQEAGVPNRSVVASTTTATVALKGVLLMLSGYLIDRWGRKPILLFSLGGQVVTLTAYAYLFEVGPWQVSLAVWVVYNLFYGSGLGCVCVVVMAEAFPDAKVRGIGVAFCYILNRVVAAVMTGIYPWQHDVLGVQKVFYLFALSALIGFIMIVVMMKDSRAEMLEHAACT